VCNRWADRAGPMNARTAHCRLPASPLRNFVDTTGPRRGTPADARPRGRSGPASYRGSGSRSGCGLSLSPFRSRAGCGITNCGSGAGGGAAPNVARICPEPLRHGRSAHSWLSISSHARHPDFALRRYLTPARAFETLAGSRRVGLQVRRSRLLACGPPSAGGLSRYEAGVFARGPERGGHRSVKTGGPRRPGHTA
jgi:hypothetical protein